MTPKEQAAMQQALEALEAAGAVPNWFTDYRHKSITALREALSEQATISGGLCGGCAKKAADGWALYCVECWEKAEQRSDSERMEPVWWHYRINGNLDGFYHEKPDNDVYDEGTLTPLYAAPVRTKDLTDDEIYIAVGSAGFGASLIAGCRAVIAADREKNK